MAHSVRLFMIIEALAFLAASLIHGGLLIQGHEHREARIAETVIAVVLLVGLAATWIGPRWARRAGLAAQGFALLGTSVGIVTIVIGIGPRTVLDIVYHIAIVIVLVLGLVAATRLPSDERRLRA
jgi:hypothetical protein